MTKLPHFVLFSRSEGLAKGEGLSSLSQGEHEYEQGGSWYFRILENNGSVALEASDFEPNMPRERLELLAVVRGLEAFGQPSRVTLNSPNPQISRAVRQGLDYWRDRNWMWEQFGEKVPMRNSDLWIRIDRAIQIHEIRCRTHRLDTNTASTVPRPKLLTGDVLPSSVSASLTDPPKNDKRLKQRVPNWVGAHVSGLNRLAADGLRKLAGSLSSLDGSPQASG